MMKIRFADAREGVPSFVYTAAIEIIHRPSGRKIENCAVANAEEGWVERMRADGVHGYETIECPVDIILKDEKYFTQKKPSDIIAGVFFDNDLTDEERVMKEREIMGSLEKSGVQEESYRDYVKALTGRTPATCSPLEVTDDQGWTQWTRLKMNFTPKPDIITSFDHSRSFMPKVDVISCEADTEVIKSLLRDQIDAEFYSETKPEFNVTGMNVTTAKDADLPPWSAYEKNGSDREAIYPLEKSATGVGMRLKSATGVGMRLKIDEMVDRINAMMADPQ